MQRKLDARVPVAATIDDALAIVQPCLDPLLSATAAGTWRPDAKRWVT